MRTQQIAPSKLRDILSVQYCFEEGKVGLSLAPIKRAPRGCAPFLVSCSFFEGEGSDPPNVDVEAEDGMVAPSLSPPNSSGHDEPMHPGSDYVTKNPSLTDSSSEQLARASEPQNDTNRDSSRILTEYEPGHRDTESELMKASVRKGERRNGVSDELSELGDAAGGFEDEAGVDCELRRRKVQWTDSHGKDLVQVHEFEPSDTGDSEEDEEDGESQACTCVIQ